MEKKKNGCLIAALCVVVFGTVSCATMALLGSIVSRDDNQQAVTEPIQTQTEGLATETEILQTQTESLQTETETHQTQTEIPSRSLDDLDIHFVGEVPNDVTGNMRYSTMTGSDTDFQEYAILYYQKYMHDKEVHAIINKECGHTIRINNWGDYALSVAFLEYQDGEENDASTICGGDLIDEYTVTIGTGEIEHVDPEE